MTADPRASCAVLVPSFRRPRDLERCLRALANQTRLPEQVIVVARPDDMETRDCVVASVLGITEVLVERGGQVAALNAGLAAVRSDVVAITDDDAAPRPDWLDRIMSHLADELVVGVGGRDVVINSVRALVPVVGMVKWHGRVVGDHHRGTGPARQVDVLKGTNMAFRTAWLRPIGFDERLRGAGAQVHNDLRVSLQIRAAGGTLVYDPAVVVDHHPALRPAGDDRADLDFRSVSDATHNETLALLEFLPVHRRLPYIAWGIVWGTRRSPGLAVAAGLVGKHGLLAPRALAGALEGRATGARSSHHSRTSRVGIEATPRHLVRRMHAPKLRNIRGVAIELRAGLAALSDWRGKARWAADVFLQRAPVSLQGRHRAAPRTIRLKSGVRLRYRLNAGDLQSLREVWLDETYRFPEEVGAVETIVDLGANIGLTSVYLARRHRARRLVAVEPVPTNAEIARQNLALNGIEGDVVEAAIAATDGVAYFEDADASNAGQVADNGRPTRAISIATVLAGLDTDIVDILKVDIEGAEEQLFSGDLTWLQSVRMLLVEFHPAIVDYPRLVGVLEDAGFRHIPAGSVYAHSATAFVRQIAGVR